jgi:hypothetical protein
MPAEVSEAAPVMGSPLEAEGSELLDVVPAPDEVSADWPEAD